MFSMITNIYNKKTKGPTLIELFTATGKQKKFFFWQLEMLDMYHGWHSTHRLWYSISCHARVNVGVLIFFTAAMIHAFRSARSHGNGGMNTRSLTYSQRKKSQGVMSGDLRGHFFLWSWNTLWDVLYYRTLEGCELPESLLHTVDQSYCATQNEDCVSVNCLDQ
jgi:hypothetical protein